MQTITIKCVNCFSGGWKDTLSEQVPAPGSLRLGMCQRERHPHLDETHIMNGIPGMVSRESYPGTILPRAVGQGVGEKKCLQYQPLSICRTIFPAAQLVQIKRRGPFTNSFVQRRCHIVIYLPRGGILKYCVRRQPLCYQKPWLTE